MPTPRKEPRYRRMPNGTFYAFWYDEAAGESRRESLGTKDPAQARERFAKWLAITGEVQQKGALTVSDAMQYYLRNRQFRSELSRERAEACSKAINRVLGHILVSDLTRAHSTTYRARRGSLSTGTVRREIGALIAAIRFAAHDELVDRVPKLDMPPAPPPRDRWLTSAEIDRVLAVAADRRNGPRLSRAERFLWIAIETGARYASITKLGWSQVDLSAGIIDFRTPGKTRTVKRQAQVPISERLRPILERAWAERQNDLWVLDKRGAVRRSLAAIFREAGLHDVTPHTLRHTCATQMARAGVPMFVIAQVLGDDISTVTRNYLHHDPEHLKQYLDYARS
jgi:integrase